MLLLLLAVMAMTCLMQDCMMLNSISFILVGIQLPFVLCRQEMGYNYYIPGRNDPFMKGALHHLYCHLQQSWLSCVQAVQALMHMWAMNSCVAAMPPAAVHATLGDAYNGKSCSACDAHVCCCRCDEERQHGADG